MFPIVCASVITFHASGIEQCHEIKHDMQIKVDSTESVLSTLRTVKIFEIQLLTICLSSESLVFTSE
jgi:hypothetical protein